LAFGQKVIADFNRLVDQASGIAAQVEYQTLEVGEGVDGVIDLLRGGFVKHFQVNVAHARPNFVAQVYGRVGNLVSDEVEEKRLGLALTDRAYLHVRAFRPSQLL
jgi:hypothetical protein